MARQIDRGPKTGEVIAQRIRRRIVTGELPIGERLPAEEELTQEFGIARTTLREALRVLESEGLIKILRGRGGGPIVTRPTVGTLSKGLAVTLQLDGTTVGHLDEARQLLEPRLAGKLALDHTAEDITDLYEIVAMAEEAAEKNDRKMFVKAAARMHQAILYRSGNPAISILAALVNDLVYDYYMKSTEKTDSTSLGEAFKRGAKSYRKLVDYIREGKDKDAEEYWRTVMMYTISRQDSTRLLKAFAD